ncbi:MAG: helix-turn-helix domain-containing protein [Patescibacteria group bacterium]|nr:helix-turn-helix domain-containing protein [Patescibacteria group bacterium]
MSGFVKKNIFLDQDSVGAYIKKNRQKKSISLEEASLKTGINIKYLKAIEESSYRDLPKGVYAKIFFKKYVDFLDIRHKNIVSDFVKEYDRSQNFEKNIFFNKVVSWKSFVSLPRVLRNLLIFLVVVICLFYLFFYLKNIFAPPFLEVYNVEDRQIINSSSVLIEGKTDAESEVSINGEAVLSDASGQFSEVIYLKSGINFIHISAKKKYSKQNLIIKQILVEK